MSYQNKHDFPWLECVVIFVCILFFYFWVSFEVEVCAQYFPNISRLSCVISSKTHVVAK